MYSVSDRVVKQENIENLVRKNFWKKICYYLLKILIYVLFKLVIFILIFYVKDIIRVVYKFFMDVYYCVICN